MAERLENVLGIPAAFWRGLEVDFWADLLRVDEENESNGEMRPVEKITLRMDAEAIAYFRKASEKVGISYQVLMSCYLTEYAASHGY